MNMFFNYATPVVYWFLIIIWAYIFIFYVRKISVLDSYNKLLKLLLIILAIDAFRSFFESVYFGAWYTSYSGLLPISVFNFLAKPEVVFVPKIINLITAFLVLMLIIRKWLSSEIDQNSSINNLIEKQTSEIKKLSAAVEQSANTIVITDLNGDIEYVNPKFTEITGYSAEEVLGANPRVLNSGAQSKTFYNEMWQTISKGEVWKGEFKNISKSGEIFWEQATISPIKNDSGETTNYLAVKENITALKESEQRLKTIINASPNIIIYKDGDGRLREVNKIILDMFHLESGDCLGKTFSELKKDYPEYKETLEHFEETDTIAWEQKSALIKEETFKDLNGNNVILEVVKVPLFNDDASKKALVILGKNITEVRQKEVQLSQSRELMNKAGELAKVGGWEINLPTMIPSFTKVTHEIYGLPLDQPLKTVEEGMSFYPPESHEIISEVFRNALEKGEPYDIEVPFINFKGENLWVRTAGWPERKDGTVVRLYGSIQDITERKKNELELINAKVEAEKSDQLKTEFLNNMSHEIRTPLNGILGFSDMLSNPDLAQEKRRNFVSIIQNSGKQLLNIIDDILDISILETKQVKVVEEQLCLNDVLLELFSIFDIKAKENKTPLFVIKNLSDEKSTIFTDKTKLYKIVSNLLENALKFTNNGFIEFGYQLKGEEIEIYVKDTGIGIELEKQEIIFERFSQAEKDLSKKVGGLGLGLSIVKENIELLGGEIRVESNVGVGSSFFVTIPYKPVLKNIKAKETESKCTILIAEDEEINYLYLETMINVILKLNCNILHAKNGEEAVDICKSNQNIDFVFMDLKMPVMCGYEATKKIKELYPDLVIVAQTAYSTVNEKEEALLAGCDDFISKPISPETFSIIINKYFKSNS